MMMNDRVQPCVVLSSALLSLLLPHCIITWLLFNNPQPPFSSSLFSAATHLDIEIQIKCMSIVSTIFAIG